MTQLSFEITPHIQRYLEDILYLHNEWKPHSVFYLIKKDKDNKVLTPKQRENNTKFWRYLSEKKAVEIFLFPKTEVMLDKMKGHKSFEVAIARTYDNEQVPVKRYFSRETKEGLKNTIQQIKMACLPSASNRSNTSYFLIRLLDIESVKKIHKIIKELKTKESETGVRFYNTENLITRNGEGDFFYGFGQNKKYIRFIKEEDYYKIFLAVFEISENKKAGKNVSRVYITYDEINDHLKKFYKMFPRSPKQIQNAFNNTIKRKYLSRAPDNREIFVADNEKKGMFFYNPPLE